VTLWSVYMVRCRGGSLYTGITTDVARRLAQHRAGDGRGARYLRGKRPLRLVFTKAIGSRGLALRVESRIKRLAKARKAELIGGDDLFETILAQAGKTMPRGLIARRKPSTMAARHG